MNAQKPKLKREDIRIALATNNFELAKEYLEIALVWRNKAGYDKQAEITLEQGQKTTDLAQVLLRNLQQQLKKKRVEKSEAGFTLLELLVVLAVLIITAAGGVVVWQKKVSPSPTPSPTPTQSFTPTQAQTPTPVPTQGSGFKFSLECKRAIDCPINCPINCPDGSSECCGTVKCESGRCVYYPAVSPAKISKNCIGCNGDSDCFLTNEKLLTEKDICWPGACSEIDYSLDIFIAVNKGSFQQFVSSYRKECGPPPSCPNKVINTNFEARCLNNVCKKISK